MNEVLYQFELDKRYIAEYPLETTEGTKKMIKTYHINAVNSRNAYINNKIEEYISLKDKVYGEMQKRVNELIPLDSSNDYTDLNKYLKLYEKIIKYNNPINSVYEKLDFDKIIVEMGDIEVTDLSEVNTFIKQILNIFTAANIAINIEDFNYSMFTYEYMKTYFNNINTENFNDSMKEIFNQIYWECPNIITHLKLNLRYLYCKYHKQLELYFTNLNNDLLTSANTNNDKYKNDYLNICNTIEEKKDKDKYLLSYKFLNNQLSIYEYLDNTPQVRKHYNRFLFEQDFNDLEEKTKQDFYAEIKKLKHVVVELNNYNLYKDFIKDIQTRYKNKDTYKGIYQTKLKEIEKEEKERTNLMNDYNKQTSFFLFKKKINKDLIKVQMIEKIKKLDALYDELDDVYINEIILNNLNETSTIYDTLNIFNSYYSYFKKIYQKQQINNKEIDFIDEYNQLSNYVNNINNQFIGKIKFIEEIDINEMIFEKYKLLNINIKKDELTDNIKGLEESIDFINLRHNLLKSNISIEKIKFIIDFSKINKN